MTACPNCRAELSEDGACPSCGAAAGSDERADPSASGSASVRPAHLAVLEAAGAPVSEEEANERTPKRRLVSTAGPAVPVRKQANDSVPTSWMSRLEAARSVTTPPSATPTEAPSQAPRPAAAAAEGPARPPPLRPGQGSQPKKEEPAAKPAHLLIAQLEAEEKKRSTAQAERVAQLFEENHTDDIAKVQILVKDEPKKKKVPDWAVALVLIVLVVGAAGLALVKARDEPGPKAEIDPVIQAQAEKRRLAVAALEEGHRLALEGKDRADDALKAYTRALELDPTLASAERGLAIAYAAKNDDTAAVEHYRKYLTLSPKAPDAGEVRKIIETYEKAQKKAESKDSPKRR